MGRRARVAACLVTGPPSTSSWRRRIRAYIKIALIGGAEVVHAARRVMIHIDAITYGRDTFDTDAWREVLAAFEEAARYA